MPNTRGPTDPAAFSVTSNPLPAEHCKRGTLSAQPRRPSAHQVRILEVLADSRVPLKTTELARRVGLFVSELQNACVWLHANRYIKREVKRIKQDIGKARVFKRIAFWSLK